jgi:Glycosyl transferase 4-like domain
MIAPAYSATTVPDPLPPGGQTRVRGWRVLHACEFARDVLPVAEGQVAVGMFPYIVTPHGAGAAELYLSGKDPGPARPLSLLRSWQDVRNWRKAILDCAPETTADLVHAHSFASGMAAVRCCACVVYDLQDCIDELALDSGQCNPGSWIGRSFRAAEQFVLSRAATVIVHSLGMKDAALERGAPPESVFLVPDPLLPEDEPATPHPDPGAADPQTLTFLAPQPPAPRERMIDSSLMVLEAFAMTRQESPRASLLLETPSSLRSTLLERVAALEIAGQVRLIAPSEMAASWHSAQVVIALGNPPAEAAIARRPNDVCLKTMRQGLALLAADLPRNRDASPSGRGCLWFEVKNARDLGGRMVFLAEHPDFRDALARTGRAHLLETRNTAVIGRSYDEAYRHAAGRKKSPGTGPGLAVLHPAANCA